ncbi:MAG: DUF1232 domain-containing protein [Bacteroidales bacterium]|nr:DUF1232 domain-containing protein [Bacteroidales bacterium]MBD5224314.1 DUF1232 domain-containing protein [Bacteroidales bacterium]
MQETGITTTSTKGAWVWAILCGLYTISPIDIIPDVFPVVGWLDDALAVVGGGLNLIQANLAKTNETLAGIIKFVKWTTIILGGILVAVVALLGVGIYNIIK